MSKRCGAKTTSSPDGAPCKAWAMENGRCRKHGGKAGRPPSHGLYSVKHRKALQAKMEEYLADPQPVNLFHELAMQRALFADFADRFTDSPISQRTREHAFVLLEAIGRTVERIDRCMNRAALTANEVTYLQATIVDMVLKFIPQDKMTAFLSELRVRMGFTAPKLTITLDNNEDEVPF